MNSARVNRITRAKLALAGLATGLVCVSSLAHAQSWLPDRNYTEGPGIRAGNLEIHPGVAVRGGYDNNVFRADGDAQRIEGAGILAVTPHINLQTLGQQRKTEGEDRAERPVPPSIAFKGGLAATYLHYFITDGPRNLEVDTDLALTVAPQRPISADVGVAYQRNARPFTQRAGGQSRTAYLFNAIAPRARLNLSSRSQVLSSYLGYAPRITLYESDVFNYLNNFQHGIQGGAAWRFLPSTALVYEAQLDFQKFSKDLDQTDSPVVFSDNKRFRTRLGINGALTRFLTLRVLAGYAVGFFDDPALSDFEAVIGDATLGYRFGPSQVNTFALGYQRDVQASALGGWLRQDRGFATLTTLIGKIFQLGLEAGAAYLTYGRLLGRPAAMGNFGVVGLGQNNDTSRNDVRLDGAVRGELRVTNWLAFTADVSVQTLITDFEYSSQIQGVTIPDPARYFAVTAFGGVRAHY